MITIQYLHHHNRDNIAIYFPYDGPIIKKVKKIPCISWSGFHKCWYVPLTKLHYRLVLSTLSEIEIDTAPLKKFLRENKVPGTGLLQQRLPGVSGDNVKELSKLLEYLHLKAYSKSTIKTYRNEFTSFLKLAKEKPVREFSREQLKRYILYCIKTEKLQEATIHSRINALKYYYEQVLGKEKMFFEIPRPKKPLQLPKVMGEMELGRLFNALTNKKHKAILFTAYSAGLRVSEVVNLTLPDIDSDRMQLFIRRAKGKKDRVVNLSPVLLDLLRAYYKSLGTRPLKYLFEGQVPGTPYSVKSAQRVFQMAKEKAGISKDVSFHALRHSFATHLLEKGVDIRYIKDILGHFSIKTTERYLHVRKDVLVNISSPLDDLFAKQGLKW